MAVNSELNFVAGLDDVVLYSHGSKLLGGFYRGAGGGLRPTTILLHGVPGVEKNLDIAYALRSHGWNCLYFHYRGSWGSEGEYSFSGALNDVQAAIEWVIGQRSVDPDRLTLVGNSFGGYVALAVTAQEPRIRATVSITPLVDASTAALPPELFHEFAEMVNGVEGAELIKQWEDLPSLTAMREALDARPVLLVTADRDEIFPVSHYESFSRDLSGLTWIRIADADHVFSSNRKALVRTTVEWLIEQLGR